MTPEIQANYCSECGRPVAPEEMVRFGDRMVCPNCKNAYAQKLREGVTPAGFVQYGGFWVRFVAYLIDAVILIVPLGILQALLLGATGFSVFRPPVSPNPTPDEIFRMMGPIMAAAGLAGLISMVLACAYEGFFLSKYAATPGKMAMGLKVLRPDGSMLSLGRAIGRHFAKILSGIILYIGYIMAGFDSEKRALHDTICDTRVIKTRG